MSKGLALFLLAGLALTAEAACPSWATAERFILNGAEVTDKRTGLNWKRCSEGQSWSGSTCTGTSSTHTHEAALALVKTANPGDSASGWRLPDVKELASLADKGCQNPAIDSTAFPVTPSNWFWTSSPYVGNSNYAWRVSFSSGGVSHGGERNNSYAVRLVRASQ